MRRFYILLILIIYPIYFSFAQAGKVESDVLPEFPMKDGRLVYEYIDSTVQLSKAKLFSKAKKWVAKNFISAKTVTQSEDQEAGSLIVKGNGDLPSVLPFMAIDNIKFTIDITCKDNKYRVQFYDLLGTSKSLLGIETPPVIIELACKKEIDVKKLKKKELKESMELKEKACASIEGITNYIQALSRSIHFEMKLKDDF